MKSLLVTSSFDLPSTFESIYPQFELICYHGLAQEGKRLRIYRNNVRWNHTHLWMMRMCLGVLERPMRALSSLLVAYETWSEQIWVDSAQEATVARELDPFADESHTQRAHSAYHTPVGESHFPKPYTMCVPSAALTFLRTGVDRSLSAVPPSIL